MLNYSAISGATTELLWSQGIIWPGEVDWKELKLKSRVEETKTSRQPKITGQTEHFTKHCLDLKNEGVFTMPISYAIPPKPLWKDALFGHVRRFMVLQQKYISSFHNKQRRITSPNKPLDLP